MKRNMTKQTKFKGYLLEVSSGVLLLSALLIRSTVEREELFGHRLSFHTSNSLFANEIPISPVSGTQKIKPCPLKNERSNILRSLPTSIELEEGLVDEEVLVENSTDISADEVSDPSESDERLDLTNPKEWISETVTENAWTPQRMEGIKSILFSPPDEESWRLASWSLCKCPNPEVLSWIASFLDSNAPVHMRAEMIRVLSYRSEPGVVELLERETRLGEEIPRRTAERALSHIRSRENRERRRP